MLDDHAGDPACWAGEFADHLGFDVPPPTALPGPLVDAAWLAAALDRGGDVVVAYDDTGGTTTARLWWMLHVLGGPVAVLDGGLAAWAGPLETGAVESAPRLATPRPWPADRIVTLDDVAAIAAGRSDAVLLDARAAERHRGGVVAVDPRPGRIPGARSAPTTDNLGPDGRLLAPAELAQRYAPQPPARSWCRAARASPPATTRWPRRWPDCRCRASTSARTPSGRPTRPARSRPVEPSRQRRPVARRPVRSTGESTAARDVTRDRTSRRRTAANSASSSSWSTHCHQRAFPVGALDGSERVSSCARFEATRRMVRSRSGVIPSSDATMASRSCPLNPSPSRGGAAALVMWFLDVLTRRSRRPGPPPTVAAPSLQ